jgi:hypothetical protein
MTLKKACIGYKVCVPFSSTTSVATTATKSSCWNTSLQARSEIPTLWDKRREGRMFSPCHSQHQVVKTDRKVAEVWLHKLLASASEGSKWSVSHPVPFSPRRLKCTISRMQVSYLFIVTIDIWRRSHLASGQCHYKLECPEANVARPTQRSETKQNE